jgi:hypothetical protein
VYGFSVDAAGGAPATPRDYSENLRRTWHKKTMGPFAEQDRSSEHLLIVPKRSATPLTEPDNHRTTKQYGVRMLTACRP